MDNVLDDNTSSIQYVLLGLEWFVGETYDSNGGYRKSGSRAITDIFLISATKDVRVSVDSCGYVICCYDEKGIYLGQPNRAKTALQIGKTDWVTAGTETTYFELLAIDPSIAQIAIIAENPELPAFTIEFVLSPTAIADPESFIIGYQIGCRLRMQRGARKPIGYLYNGVLLPELPEWDSEKYPYAVMLWDSNNTKSAWLYLSTAKLHKNDTSFSSVFKAAEDGSCVAYQTSYDATSFERAENLDSTFSKGEPVSWIACYPKWANYDVLKYNTTDVYLLASDPVPVYE